MSEKHKQELTELNKKYTSALKKIPSSLDTDPEEREPKSSEQIYKEWRKNL